MAQIIEDTISRNRKFKEERLLRVARLKELKAPEILIAREEFISTLTPTEYELLLKEEEEQEKKFIAEYAKNNPLQKEIVDEIYKRVEALNYNYLTYSSRLHFIMAIDPLKFMSRDDYYNDLYVTFLNHAQQIYIEKFKKDFDHEESTK